MFLQLWPVIHSVNKADDCSSQSHGREKIKLGEETISEILVADGTSELGVESSDVNRLVSGIIIIIRRRKRGTRTTTTSVSRSRLNKHWPVNPTVLLSVFFSRIKERHTVRHL
jgi:hypothetical protein